MDNERRNFMPMVMQKDEAHKLIDRMPSNATWDDLMREIYVREVIESGLADSNEGRTRDMKEVRAKYGLTE
jgi:predicted transcriptional regulator